jgi:hypothetical protein
LTAAIPRNAILLIGMMQTANLEIGVPAFQPQVPKSTSEFTLIANPNRCRRIEFPQFSISENYCCRFLPDADRFAAFFLWT